VGFDNSSLKSISLEDDLLEIVERDFVNLYSGNPSRSPIPGGQSAANRALESLDISGYACDRSQVLPKEARGASMLSPYIRHNLLTLKQVYEAVSNAPFKDRLKYQDELLWQEYARHLYARIGVRLFENLRYNVNRDSSGAGWETEMLCIKSVVGELETDGWLVNQARMWLASHWSVRNDKGWIHGQEEMFRHLIDGSRAANLLGWQWSVGASTGRVYGFARWQVEKRAPGLCKRCQLRFSCPIQNFPDERILEQLPREPLLESDHDLAATTGPKKPEIFGKPRYVLLTIDSLGDGDPALIANPGIPAVFIFNHMALAKLQLSAKRISFYLETLKDLSCRRELNVFLGDPYLFATQNPVAITFAPVPSFKKFTQRAVTYPYPWLVYPHGKSLKSFSAWRGAITLSV